MNWVILDVYFDWVFENVIDFGGQYLHFRAGIQNSTEFNIHVESCYWYDRLILLNKLVWFLLSLVDSPGDYGKLKRLFLSALWAAFSLFITIGFIFCFLTVDLKEFIYLLKFVQNGSRGGLLLILIFFFLVGYSFEWFKKVVGWIFYLFKVLS